MVSCLILCHTTILSLTKCKILHAMFNKSDHEIHELENNAVIIYLWNINKVEVWQAALLFETTNILVGYGFGDRKDDAKEQAQALLWRRKNLEKKL